MSESVVLDAPCAWCDGDAFNLDLRRLEAICVSCGCVDEHIIQGPKREPRRGPVRGCMPWFA
jgi:transcription initiation factor TFIIIB Brf1 subunit/transcription initiation factor TFIIB